MNLLKFEISSHIIKWNKKSTWIIFINKYLMILRCDHIVWDQIYFIKTFSIFEYSTSHNNGKIFNSRWLLLTFLNDKIMLVTNRNILRIAHQNKNRFFPLFSNKYPSFIRVTWNLKECCNNNVHRIRIHIQTTAIAYMLL